MNKIKILIIALAAMLSDNISAQDNYRPWLVGAGINTVDMRVPSDFSGIAKDWFGYPDMNVSFRVSAARYIKKGITAEVAFALNSITKDETYFPEAKNTISGKTFWGADVRARYHLNRLWSVIPWFDPYPQLGIGISSIEGESKANLVAGLGANFWFTDIVGANLQTTYNPAFGGGIGKDYFQWGAGVVIKLPFKARENPIVDHVEREKLPKEPKKRKKVSQNKSITRQETDEERQARLARLEAERQERVARVERVTKEINLYAKTILFDTDKSVVKTQAEFILDNIAKIMNENKDFHFVIEGHTDNVGSAEHNLKLSQDRADSIKKYLIQKGIDKKRLEAKGYGLTRPLENNNTERGREINRRVEINVIPLEVEVEIQE